MTQRMTQMTVIGAAALLLALLAGVAGAMIARPAAAQTSGAPVRQVTVQGHGQAAGSPDTATVQIGVETQAPTAAEALAQNNAQAAALIQKLRDLGVTEKDIQTANVSVGAVYGPDGRQVEGYRVANSVSVTIRDLAGAGALLDEVVKAGANSVYGIGFSVADPAALLAQARELAVADARSRAEQLAKASGGTLGAVLVVSEGGVAQPPIPMMARAEDAAAGVPVQPGEQSFGADVTVTFELR